MIDSCRPIDVRRELNAVRHWNPDFGDFVLASLVGRTPNQYDQGHKEAKGFLHYFRLLQIGFGAFDTRARILYGFAMKDNKLWEAAGKDIFWYQPPTELLDDSNPPFYRWFPDGVTNACFNALDIHVEQGRGEQAAIIHDSPVTNSKTTLSYAQLLDRVSRFAGVLSTQGVEKSDRVLIYMPMVPEAVVAMLACARLGAVHSVVFGGFRQRRSSPLRIDDAEPEADRVPPACGIEPASHRSVQAAARRGDQSSLQQQA